MTAYEVMAQHELHQWKLRMQRKASFTGQLAKKLQVRINRVIPEKVHIAITTAIKHMIRAVCFGAEYTTPWPMGSGSLEARETRIRERIKFYRNTAAAEGALTGAGGILLGLADFPLWLTLKMKMLFEIAALYGYDVTRYKERIFLLHIFELTFSSQVHRNKVYAIIEDWQTYERQLPEDINEFDWRSFQQEYRDYIDIAKLLQLVPGIGAAVGAIVNHRLTEKLGNTAMNAYRLRGESVLRLKV
ncbi:EcsC family protein [Fulvivirgaceae bacterium PWU4]|uniref:EcsC family protein n=1 Tax=Chryseosolibacter histidini TaxID=2782349 RepID=A0AAP2DPB1_9BACT|nr:EcsC family protein [Chryseosolibacter histidini]MBT1700066.1 EcsC family protein [Chryseosolibacter histidini]